MISVDERGHARHRGEKKKNNTSLLSLLQEPSISAFQRTRKKPSNSTNPPWNLHIWTIYSLLVLLPEKKKIKARKHSSYKVGFLYNSMVWWLVTKTYYILDNSIEHSKTCQQNTRSLKTQGRFVALKHRKMYRGSPEYDCLSQSRLVTINITATYWVFRQRGVLVTVKQINNQLIVF